jgi:hypothetical protein
MMSKKKGVFTGQQAAGYSQGQPRYVQNGKGLILSE